MQIRCPPPIKGGEEEWFRSWDYWEIGVDFGGEKRGLHFDIQRISFVLVYFHVFFSSPLVLLLHQGEHDALKTWRRRSGSSHSHWREHYTNFWGIFGIGGGGLGKPLDSPFTRSSKPLFTLVFKDLILVKTTVSGIPFGEPYSDVKEFLSLRGLQEFGKPLSKL
mgnify:CR=1 FL=1